MQASNLCLAMLATVSTWQAWVSSKNYAYPLSCMVSTSLACLQKLSFTIHYHSCDEIRTRNNNIMQASGVCLTQRMFMPDVVEYNSIVTNTGIELNYTQA